MRPRGRCLLASLLSSLEAVSSVQTLTCPSCVGRVADERRDGARRMRQINLQFSVDHLRMSKHLVQPVDRRARNSDWLKH